MTILFILATIFGVVSGIANLPQAIKIFKLKDAKDISIITYSFLLVAMFIWILYGIELKNLAILVANILGFINVGLVVIGWIKYGR